MSFVEAPDLDQRLESLAEVDRKIIDIVATAKEILVGYDKERQHGKQKLDAVYKRYEESVDAVNKGISEQLAYMERMCVGAEHQGSTFPIQQQTEMMRKRMTGLRNGLSEIATLAAAMAAENASTPQNEPLPPPDELKMETSP